MDARIIKRGAALAAVAASLLLLPLAFPPKTAVVMGDSDVPPPASASALTDPSANVTPQRPGSPSSSRTPADTQRPSAVTNLQLASNNATTFTLVWSPSTDNVGIADYAVMLDGHLIGYVPEETVTLMWPGGSAEFHVSIAARDTSGNWSEWRKVVIVPPPPAVQRVPQRTFRPQTPATPTPTPTPEPTTVTPTPTPTPSVTPTPTPTPSSTPSPTPSVTPSVTPTATPSGTPSAPVTPITQPSSSPTGTPEPPVDPEPTPEPELTEAPSPGASTGTAVPLA